jgi:hypothetical protein
MSNGSTASMQIHLVDGTRAPVADTLPSSGTLFDGRDPDSRRRYDLALTGPEIRVNGLPFFDNLFDNYTVIVNAEGYETAAWRPVHVLQEVLSEVSLMLIAKDAGFKFALWESIQADWPTLFRILSQGLSPTNAQQRYSDTYETHAPEVACFLNLVTAMADIKLPSGKAPVDYDWQLVWPGLAPDRFLAWVDENLVADVAKAASLGAFSEEKDPGVFHAGATRSWKQTRFDVANVQLTFHEHDTQVIQVLDATGTTRQVNCVMVEPDIDYYKDLLSHGLLEVLPNQLTGGKSDPRVVYFLRWVASRQERLGDFAPPFMLA